MFTGTLDTVHLFGNTVSVLVRTQLVFHFMEMRKWREISCLILFPPPHAEDIVQQDYCYFWHRIWVWHDPNREICGVIWLMAWHGNTVLCNWFSSVWNGVLFFFIIICSVYRAYSMLRIPWPSCLHKMFSIYAWLNLLWFPLLQINPR